MTNDVKHPLRKISAEQEAALHQHIEEAFRLAADIRLCSGGAMTLAAVKNQYVPSAAKERAGFIGGVEWMDAHEYASMLAALPEPEPAEK